MANGTDQTLTTDSVLLSGASSQIGVFAIPGLLRAGFRVLAVSRKGKPEGYPSFEHVKWLNEAEAMQAAEGCRYLLSVGPMELANKFLAAGKQYHHAVVFSSSSVESKQTSDNPNEKRQIQGLLSLESELRLSAKINGFKLLILRPTLIYGCGLDTNISRLAGWIRRFGFIPVNGKAAGLRQPVHADDLASAAIAAMVSKNTLPQTLTLAGGSTLSYADMVRCIFVALEKPVRLVHLPQWLFILLLHMLSIIRPGWALNSEMVRRQQIDLVFEDLQARELLNFEPRPFSPVKEDFVLPVTEN